MRKKRRKIEAGQRFGKLVTCSFTKKSHSTVWLCKCDCGTQKEVTTGHLGRSTNSCGCLKAEQRIYREEKAGTRYQQITGKYWASVKGAAQRRKIPFKLTLKEAWAQYEKQGKICALSGVEIVFAESARAEDILKQTASLDRIDSSKGYVIGNVQWLHKRVNEMKNSDSDQGFIAWCKKIVDYQQE